MALSAAHAYPSVTRQPQAVLVHVDAGTQNLGGAISKRPFGPVAPAALSAWVAAEIALALARARNPLVVTTRSWPSTCAPAGRVVI